MVTQWLVRPLARQAAALGSLLLLREPRGLDAPYVPTPDHVVRRMLALAAPQAGELVVDLGCGDGRLVIEAARLYGARGLGVDLDRRRLIEARRGAAVAGVLDRVRFARQDLFACDLSAADVLTLYLFPDVNFRLQPRIFGAMRPGARVVSHDFDMGEWLPDAVSRAPEDLAPARLYLVPGWVAGLWRGQIDGAEAQLQLDQTYQRVEGAAPRRGWLVRDGLLAGPALTAVLAPADGPERALRAVVDADRLTGTLDDEPFTLERLVRDPIRLSHARQVTPRA